jgi:ubiquinone biosynthesis protein UbiJ
VLTELVENVLNRNLDDSPAARNLCAALHGQRLFLIVSGLDLRLSIESLGSTLRLQRNPEGDSHATLEGSPLSLIALAGPQPERQLQSGAVRIRGDAEVLQRYRELALLLRPDLEGELARLVGDGLAHSMGRVTRSMLDLGLRGSRTAVRNTAEYFAHESGDLVPRGQAEVFFADVDRLREDVDRAAARLDALLNHRQAGEPFDDRLKP